MLDTERYEEAQHIGVLQGLINDTRDKLAKLGLGLLHSRAATAVHGDVPKGRSESFVARAREHAEELASAISVLEAAREAVRARRELLRVVAIMVVVVTLIFGFLWIVTQRADT